VKAVHTLGYGQHTKIGLIPATLLFSTHFFPPLQTSSAISTSSAILTSSTSSTYQKFFQILQLQPLPLCALFSSADVLYLLLLLEYKFELFEQKWCGVIIFVLKAIPACACHVFKPALPRYGRSATYCYR